MKTIDIFTTVLIAILIAAVRFIWLHGGEPAQPFPTVTEFHVGVSMLATLLCVIGIPCCIVARN